MVLPPEEEYSAFRRYVSMWNMKELRPGKTIGGIPAVNVRNEDETVRLREVGKVCCRIRGKKKWV